MVRSRFIVISDDQDFVQRARAFGNSSGATVEVFSTSEWEMKNPEVGVSQTLAMGTRPVEVGAKILPFPGNHVPSNQVGKKVQTINELESVAIEKAIYEYNGNLTEAAKALGIGRATLYRKVKQYNIDPTMARRKRVA